MKKTFALSLLFFGLFICFIPVHAQTAARVRATAALDSATDLQVMLEALATVKPVAFDSLPKNRRGQVLASGFHSFRHPEWPLLPNNFYKLPVWSLGDGVFVVDPVISMLYSSCMV